MTWPALLRRVFFLLAMPLAFAGFLTASAYPIGQHNTGDAAMSADGRYVAFYTADMPENVVFVADVQTGQSWRYELPANQQQIGDLVWTLQGHDLLFVSAKMADNPNIDRYILGGHGTHVWRIRFDSDALPGHAEILATDVGVRRPALSPDRSRLAYFALRDKDGEVPAGNMQIENASAVVEMDLPSGAAQMVSPARFEPLWNLFYSGEDHWLFSTYEAVYLRELPSGQAYWGPQDVPRGSGSFRQQTNGIRSFRLTRGEQPAEYPDVKLPYPSIDVVPLQSALAGQTEAGLPILRGAPGEENTKSNQLLNSLSWYAEGIKRTEMKEAYLVYDGDELIDAWPVPEVSGGYDSIVGGTDIDARLQHFATVRTKRPRSTKYDYSHPRNDYKLLVFSRDGEVYERFVHDIVASAEAIGNP